MRRLELFSLIALLVLAAALRMGFPGLSEFKLDEAHLYALSLQMAEFKTFPLRGIGSSVGIPNAPMSVYLFALPLFIWKSPLAATLFVGLLNTLSVGLAYVMVKRYWGLRVALIATLLYAVAPWAVIDARKIWAQDLLPLFVVGYIFSTLLTFIEGKRNWLIAHLALLVVIIQIHLSGLALGVLTALLIVLYRKQVDWRILGVSILAGLVTLIPFGIYALSLGSTDPALLTGLLSRPSQISADAVQLAMLMSMGTDVHSLAGEQAFQAFLASVPNFDLVLWLLGALVIGGGIYAIRNTVMDYSRAKIHPSPYPLPAGERGKPAALIIVLWFAIPIIFFTRHSTPVFPHYFIILYPAPFILAALALDWLICKWRIVWLVPIGIAVCQVWLTVAILNFVGTQNTFGAFGTPLDKLLQVVQVIDEANPKDVVFLSDGADPNIDGLPAAFEVLLAARPLRFVDARTAAVFPAADALVILWSGEYPIRARVEQWGADKIVGAILLRNGEGVVNIYRSGDAPTIPNPQAASVLLANGAEFLSLDQNELWWRANFDADEQYQVYTHWLDADANKLAQEDIALYRPWRAGDVAFNVLAQPQGTQVRLGMYGYPSLAPAPVLDAAGNAAGDWVIWTTDDGR